MYILVLCVLKPLKLLTNVIIRRSDNFEILKVLSLKRIQIICNQKFGRRKAIKIMYKGKILETLLIKEDLVCLVGREGSLSKISFM